LTKFKIIVRPDKFKAFSEGRGKMIGKTGYVYRMAKEKNNVILKLKM